MRAAAMTDDSASVRPRPLLVAGGLALLALLLFLANLGVPNKPVFDEVYYVEAARTLLALRAPYNNEHPLLAKLFIAGGITLFGDNGFGWRFFSAIAGAALIAGVFAIGWQLWGRIRPATYAALIALFNFTVFIQARIAMLDGYMAAFLLLAIAATIAAARAPYPRARGWLIVAAALYGAAAASKWSAAPFLLFAVLAMLWLRWRDSASGAAHFGGMRAVHMIAILALVSATVYFASFAPAFFYRFDPLTLARLLPFQWEMFVQQTAPLAKHPYQSPWWSWPIDQRPIWYLYEFADGAQRGILMIGNPFVLWAGLPAVAACLWAGLAGRDRALLGVALLWIASYGIWVVIPKKIGFFYYYYIPSVMLALAIIGASERYLAPRWRYASEAAVLASLALFLWFYPILSAAPLADDQAFLHWMWFDSWR